MNSNSSAPVPQIYSTTTCKIQNNTIYKFEQDVSLSNKRTLTVMSYNVWFENHNFVERSVELKKLFKAYSPDFICLQEVTPYFINLLINDKELCEMYYFSSPNVQNYDVLILSKFACPFASRRYQSNMGRNFVFGTLQLNNASFTIGTTHLESMSYNSAYRKGQLGEIDHQLKNVDFALFMGDLNLENDTESAFIPSSFTDVWKHLKPNEKGYTYPAASNQAVIRYDRILFRSKNALWKPTKIEIIGTQPIPLYQTKKVSWNHEITTPSDHAGLYAEFTYGGQ